jgi:hypothetical protein
MHHGVNLPFERPLNVRVDHHPAELALLSPVGPRVPTVPGSLATSTAEVTKCSASALIWSYLQEVRHTISMVKIVPCSLTKEG